MPALKVTLQPIAWLALNLKDAIDFFMAFANADCEKIAIENPVGIMSSEWRKPNQIINPWQFGDAFEKRLACG